MPLSLREKWIRRGLLTLNLAAPVSLIATRFSVPWVIVAAALAHGCLIYAIVAPGCGWLGPVVTSFRPGGREVWLTIDDGPSGADTEQLAAELRRRGVRATFFVKGCNLAPQQQVVHQLHAAGHTVANHTHTHPAAFFWALWPTRLRKELDLCNDLLARTGVTALRWFRAPAGVKHALLHRELARRGMRLIAWTVRGRDGLGSNPEAVACRVVKGVAPGAIVLLHEGKPRSAEGILRTIDELQRLGYVFVIPADEQLV